MSIFDSVNQVFYTIHRNTNSPRFYTKRGLFYENTPIYFTFLFHFCYFLTRNDLCTHITTIFLQCLKLGDDYNKMIERFGTPRYDQSDYAWGNKLTYYIYKNENKIGINTDTGK